MDLSPTMACPLLSDFRCIINITNNKTGLESGSFISRVPPSQQERSNFTVIPQQQHGL